MMLIGMTKHTYSKKLQPLLNLGEPTPGRHWEDYAARFDLTAEDEPELLRMAQDDELNQLTSKNPAVYAPVHAVRALGQVGSIAMVEPLLELLEAFGDDDWLSSDIPQTLAALGTAILPQVEQFLRDVSKSEWARCSLTAYYTEGALRFPNKREVLADSARSVLSDFDRFDNEFNGILISELMHLHARHALPTIRLAFLSNKVADDICGDYDEVRYRIENPKD